MYVGKYGYTIIISHIKKLDEYFLNIFALFVLILLLFPVRRGLHYLLKLVRGVLLGRKNVNIFLNV